jgi:hypothetical protein
MSDNPSDFIVVAPPAINDEILAIEDSKPSKKIGFSVEIVKKTNHSVRSWTFKNKTVIGIVTNIVSCTTD